MNKILVTPRSLTAQGHPALNRLVAAGYEVVFSPANRQPSEDELVGLLPGCAGYLAGVEPITDRVLEAAADLQVISRFGAGIDNIDIAAAQRRGVAICRANGTNAEGVAELSIGLLFALMRSIPRSDRILKSGLWERHAGSEIQGKTLGVIGYGKIGRRVAEMGVALGMMVIAHDIMIDTSAVASEHLRFGSLDELLVSADVISLHCPPLSNGERLIDAKALEKVWPGAFLINTARYDLLDPDAVLNALNSKRLAGLAIDVFDVEPPSDNRLVGHERVIATPHIGGFTDESRDRTVTAAVDNLLDQLQPVGL